MLPAITGATGGPETTSRSISDERVYVEVFPEHLSFGCVAAGYVYSLRVSMVNKGPKPQAFRIRCAHEPKDRDESRLRVKFVPSKLAPGVRQDFSLELIAHSTGAINFELLITQGINKLTLPFPVKALVVPLEVFKHVAKSLSLQKRPIYTNGVVVLGQIGSMDDSRSIVTGRASVLSEAMMDEGDLDELQDLPLVEGVYWDAVRKRIVTDAELCRIVVGSDFGLEESVSRTMDLREKRTHEIEDEGNYCLSTVRAMAKQAASHIKFSAGHVGDGLQQGSHLESGLAASSVLSSAYSKDGDDEPEFPIVLGRGQQVTIAED